MSFLQRAKKGEVVLSLCLQKFVSLSGHKDGGMYKGLCPSVWLRRKGQTMLFRKTPVKERETYKYHSVTGEVFEYTPEDLGEENVKLLHIMDDAIVYNNIKNSKPPIEGWQKEEIEQWKSQHPGEEPPKNWNVSIDGFTQTDDVDSGEYMKKLAEITTEELDLQKVLLYEKVSELTEEEQELFQMCYLWEIGQQEIADRKGVSQNTIRKKLRRLEARLTEMCRKEMQ